MEESEGQSNKNLAEAKKNTQTGNKPFKKGDYTDVVLDIIGGENSKALHGIQGVVGDGEPTIVEEREPVPPNAEETFILDLSPIIEEQPGSSLVPLSVIKSSRLQLTFTADQESQPKSDVYTPYQAITKSSGSSLSDQVFQTPADIYSRPGEPAKIRCSHTIPSYNQILWITMTTQDLITFEVLSLWLQGQCQDVTQHPEISWRYVSQSAEMNCSHNKDISHNQMYWYRQRPGETMTLVVYTVAGGQPDYGGVPQTKYSAIKENTESGALTVKDLQLEDSAVYFCAVSKHSDVTSMSS
ncbi:uncharacterized protein LOC144535562 [Sander vitreus]